MLKDILVHLNGTKGDAGRLAHAVAICRAHDAFLTGVYLNIAHAPMAVGYAGFGAAPILTDPQVATLAAGDKVAEGLKERMNKLDGVSHELRRYDVYLGEAIEAMCAESRCGDLFVVAQPYGKNAELSELTEALIFGSGGGLLVTPETALPPKEGIKTVLVAWRSTKESARAVSEAMPFLKMADKVIVAMVNEDGAPEQFGREPGADIARHLSRHDCNVELKHLTGWDNVAEALLNEAEKSGADLIVMGSYGHSRIRQWVLGGVTRHVLGKSPLPVLTAH